MWPGFLKRDWKEEEEEEEERRERGLEARE